MKKVFLLGVVISILFFSCTKTKIVQVDQNGNIVRVDGVGNYNPTTYKLNGSNNGQTINVRRNDLLEIDIYNFKYMTNEIENIKKNNNLEEPLVMDDDATEDFKESSEGEKFFDEQNPTTKEGYPLWMAFLIEFDPLTVYPDETHDAKNLMMNRPDLVEICKGKTLEEAWNIIRKDQESKG